jgi:hypothetical protein
MMRANALQVLVCSAPPTIVARWQVCERLAPALLVEEALDGIGSSRRSSTDADFKRIIVYRNRIAKECMAQPKRPLAKGTDIHTSAKPRANSE